MERYTANLDQVIQLSDTLRRYWDAANVKAVQELVRNERRETLEQVVYTLLNDLEAASGK